MRRAVIPIVSLLLLLAGCGTNPHHGAPVQRIAPTRVDPAFTGASTRVDPRFLNGGPYAGTANRGPLYGAATGLRRY